MPVKWAFNRADDGRFYHRHIIGIIGKSGPFLGMKMASNTRAINALREIMADETAPPRRRIEAAEGLLDYEAPSEVVEEAKAFLTTVFEDSEMAVEIRLDAVTLMRKVEARKVVPARVAVRDEPGRVEHCRLIETLRRKSELIAAGVFPLPEGWDDDLNSPDYVPTPETLHAIAEPDNRNIAEVLRDARLRHTRKVDAKSS
jgi:hypothetical protein